MRKILLFFGIILVITSCNSAPEGFCDCLSVSEKLNQTANDVLSGDQSEAKSKKLIELRSKQNEACKDFQATKGDDMRKWKKTCEDQ